MFSGRAAKIAALRVNLVFVFCLSYSLSAATPIGPPECTLNTDGNDHLSVEAVQ
jgi:hypothetical protein